MREISKPKISVVLSFWNEEDVLDELIDRLRKVFHENLKNIIDSHEFIFVNDVSTDNSLEILRKRSKEFADIKIVNMSRNFGVSPCVMAGFSYASGDAIIYMDTDLQDPPELIPEMVQMWLKDNADVVHTKRLSRKGESSLKMLITKVGYFLINKASSIHFESNVGDFKLLDRVVVNQLIKLRENRPFTRGLVTWVGFNQKTLTYHRDARAAGETKFPVYSWKVISNFLDSAIISFSDTPLKLALFFGFFISLSSFAYLIWVLVSKFFGFNLPGWTAIMATMLLLGGVQLLTIGVLGLYVNSIFIETKRRPLFIVKDTEGFSNKEVEQQVNRTRS